MADFSSWIPWCTIRLENLQRQQKHSCLWMGKSKIFNQGTNTYDTFYIFFCSHEIFLVMLLTYGHHSIIFDEQSVNLDWSKSSRWQMRNVIVFQNQYINFSHTLSQHVHGLSDPAHQRIGTPHLNRWASSSALTWRNGLRTRTTANLASNLGNGGRENE